jgi:hypothetical protein
VDTYNTTARNVFTPHASNRNIVDKKTHPAEQTSVYRAQNEIDYSTNSKNSYKNLPTSPPKRAENELHKTAIFRSPNGPDYGTTNRQAYYQVTVSEIFDSSQRQKEGGRYL